MVFSISYVWMWELEYKESWVPKNWCFWTVVVGEDSWESLELQGDQTKGNQSWIFIGKTDAKAKAPILWAPDAKELTYWERPWSWERFRQEEKGMIEEEMVGWHHRLNGHDFEQAPGDGEGQGSLACCSSWGCKIGTWQQVNNNSANYCRG